MNVMLQNTIHLDLTCEFVELIMCLPVCCVYALLTRCAMSLHACEPTQDK